MTEQIVRVYTDGACKKNPGPGGYGVRIRYPDGRVKEFGGSEESTTNNRMELKAAIEALRRTRTEKPVVVVTDSEYVRQGITSWIQGWKTRGWVTRNNKPVSNQDLWKELDDLRSADVEFEYTAGHAGDPDNERCDRIASSFAIGEPVELIDGVDHTPTVPNKHKPPKKKSRYKAAQGLYSGPIVYLSHVGGKLGRHSSWAECEKVVNGVSGALFKKCKGPIETAETLKKWGLLGGGRD